MNASEPTEIPRESDGRGFRWTVSIEVDETWVADGYEITAERIHEMMQHEIGGAYASEIGVKVLRAPKPERIRKVQGFPS